MNNKRSQVILFLITFLICGFNVVVNAQTLSAQIFVTPQSEPLVFAAKEISNVFSDALLSKTLSVDQFKVRKKQNTIVLSFGEDNGLLSEKLKIKLPNLSEPQSYYIAKVAHKGGFVTAVFGADANGAMYGGLDVAEALKVGLSDSMLLGYKKPHIAQRGIKFNIPLDLRTPSYSDCGDAAQANIPHMWEMDFWTDMLDNMARHRYNLISLWSLHPFPSLVKVPEFPDIALNDVWRTTHPLNDDFNGVGSDAVKPEMLANYEVVKTMTIDQKIKFWQDVMQYGKDRGIEFYLFTWNIFTFGTDGKYGITLDRNNDTTVAYFRASVREMIKTYPLLAGIGITAGENMQKTGKYPKESWLWETYGQGINDALASTPNRPFRLIHRFHWSAQSEILDAFKDLKCPIDFSFKYSIAHMYSMVNPPYIKELLPNMMPGMKTWLTVRNDDIYSFRWADADYARDYINAIPPADKVAGFYMGPDGYTWGRDYLTLEPGKTRQTIIDKQWFSFMLWGRLAYLPTISNNHFEKVLANRFPSVNSSNLQSAWQSASKVFPEITKFFWGDIDERWLPEACCRRKSQFYSVEHFMKQPVMPESGNLTIENWRDKYLNNKPMDGKTPLEVANSLEGYATQTLRLLPDLMLDTIGNKELRLTLGDMTSFAHIGNYYAEKIRGAAYLALYDRCGNVEYHQKAIKHVTLAYQHWLLYAASYTKQYVQPVMYNRVKLVDIPGKFKEEAARDIDIAKNWKVGTLEVAPAKAADKPFVK